MAREILGWVGKFSDGAITPLNSLTFHTPRHPLILSQSKPIKANQSQSKPIKANQSQSKPLKALVPRSGGAAVLCAAVLWCGGAAVLLL